jgi:predicted membrane protein
MWKKILLVLIVVCVIFAALKILINLLWLLVPIILITIGVKVYKKFKRVKK